MNPDAEASSNSCRPDSEETCSSECCGTPTAAPSSQHAIGERYRWQIGTLESAAGTIPLISTTLVLADHLGSWKARWGIARMRYAIPPGLYAVGTPATDAPVLVSANYKMSFDRLRMSLTGINAWILVLDTKGINVWCAAGKGTFGTDELVHRIEATSLSQQVTTRTLVLPQLGAAGVAAHEVKRRSGFRVIYGPIRAADIPTFLESEMKATPAMRLVQFPLAERLAVVPVELVGAARYILAILAALLLLSGLGPDGYSWPRVIGDGVPAAYLLFSAFLVATVLGPMLLPWLPGHAFSLKGASIGLGLLAVTAIGRLPTMTTLSDWLTAIGWLLIVPGTTSFLLMNFTGSTTYTSLSGVRQEMRIAVPLQLTAFTTGTLLLILGRCFLDVTQQP